MSLIATEIKKILGEFTNDPAQPVNKALQECMLREILSLEIDHQLSSEADGHSNINELQDLGVENILPYTAHVRLVQYFSAYTPPFPGFGKELMEYVGKLIWECYAEKCKREILLTHTSQPLELTVLTCEQSNIFQTSLCSVTAPADFEFNIKTATRLFESRLRTLQNNWRLIIAEEGEKLYINRGKFDTGLDEIIIAIANCKNAEVRTGMFFPDEGSLATGTFIPDENVSPDVMLKDLTEDASPFYNEFLATLFSGSIEDQMEALSRIPPEELKELDEKQKSMFDLQKALNQDGQRVIAVHEKDAQLVLGKIIGADRFRVRQ